MVFKDPVQGFITMQRNKVIILSYTLGVVPGKLLKPHQRSEGGRDCDVASGSIAAREAPQGSRPFDGRHTTGVVASVRITILLLKSPIPGALMGFCKYSLCRRFLPFLLSPSSTLRMRRLVASGHPYYRPKADMGQLGWSVGLWRATTLIYDQINNVLSPLAYKAYLTNSSITLTTVSCAT